MRKNIVYIAILLLVVIFYILVGVMTPRPVDWSISFSKKDKIPYGTFVLHELMDDFMPGKKLSVMHDSIYSVLKKKKMTATNYIIINNTLELDKYDTDVLLDYVKRGNAVFIAARFFLGKLGEKFKLKVEPGDLKKGDSKIRFKSKRLNPGKYYTYKKNLAKNYFTSYRKRNARVLGVSGRGRANFIRIKYGRGYFYFSSVPFAFTNFSILDGDNYQYPFKALSYLPVRATFWDEYYKLSRVAPGTPLRYILSREALKWAYYIFLVGLLLYMVFHARRRQRIIPRIDPLPNATLEFVHTIGRLYYQQGDHRDIAGKMAVFLADDIRTRYNINILHEGAEVRKQLASRTGMSRDEIAKMLDFVESVKNKPVVTSKDLFRLSNIIDDFNRMG